MVSSNSNTHGTISRRTGTSATMLFLTAVLVLALFYNSYRYPLQIGDSGTSPSYSDTPLTMQVGKYVFFLFAVLLYVAGLLITGLRHAKFRQINIMPMMIAVFSLLLSFIFTVTLGDPTYFVENIFWMFLIIGFFSSGEVDGRLIAERTWSLLWVFYWISVAFFVLEVFLFVMFDRLPALSYRESFIVRFGGLWDDPNGYSVFLSFYLPMVFIYFRSIAARVAMVIVHLTMLFCTQSISGIAASIAGLIVVILLAARSRRMIGNYFFAFKVAVVLAIGLGTLFVASDGALKAVVSFYIDYVDLKSASIDGHAHSLELLDEASGFTFLGLNPLNKHGESGAVNWIVNFGIFYLVGFIVFLIMLVRRTAILLKNTDSPVLQVYLSGVQCFALTYCFALINLPVDKVFPLNLLFSIFSLSVFLLRSEHLAGIEPMR